jgi:hypothetical protein
MGLSKQSCRRYRIASTLPPPSLFPNPGPHPPVLRLGQPGPALLPARRGGGGGVRQPRAAVLLLLHARGYRVGAPPASAREGRHMAGGIVGSREWGGGPAH